MCIVHIVSLATHARKQVTVRITCLVDNSVGHGSPLWGEHGLSFLVQTTSGAVLWDTGASGTVLDHNIQTLGLREADVQAIGLSHGHYDHTGGLEVALSAFGSVTLYAHPDLFAERYSLHGDTQKDVGIPIDQQTLASQCSLMLSAAPQQILPGVQTTGEIKERPFPQGGSSRLKAARAGRLVADTYADDMSLVLSVPSGVVLLCGCCHAGLRNTLMAVRSQYSEKLVAILGGTHLASVDDAELAALRQTLTNEDVPDLYLNHCTGNRAIFALRTMFGDHVHNCPAGTAIEF